MFTIILNGLFCITYLGLQALHYFKIISTWIMTVDLLLSPSEPESSKLSRRGGIKMKPSVKDSMVLMQDTLEEHVSLGGGGGSGGRGGRRGTTLQRRAGNSAMQNPFPKQQRHFTARIVVMGDDRVLGRLAKAYYFFRWVMQTQDYHVYLIAYGGLELVAAALRLDVYLTKL